MGTGGWRPFPSSLQGVGSAKTEGIQDMGDASSVPSQGNSSFPMVCAALNLGRSCTECIQQGGHSAHPQSQMETLRSPRLLSPTRGREQCFKTYARWIFVHLPPPTPPALHSQFVPAFNGIIATEHLPGFSAPLCKNCHFTENDFSSCIRAAIIPARLEPDLPVVPIMGCVTHTITQPCCATLSFCQKQEFQCREQYLHSCIDCISLRPYTVLISQL